MERTTIVLYSTNQLCGRDKTKQKNVHSSSVNADAAIS